MSYIEFENEDLEIFDFYSFDEEDDDGTDVGENLLDIADDEPDGEDEEDDDEDNEGNEDDDGDGDNESDNSNKDRRGNKKKDKDEEENKDDQSKNDEEQPKKDEDPNQESSKKDDSTNPDQSKQENGPKDGDSGLDGNKVKDDLTDISDKKDGKKPNSDSTQSPKSSTEGGAGNNASAGSNASAGGGTGSSAAGSGATTGGGATAGGTGAATGGGAAAGGTGAAAAEGTAAAASGTAAAGSAAGGAAAGAAVASAAVPLGIVLLIIIIIVVIIIIIVGIGAFLNFMPGQTIGKAKALFGKTMKAITAFFIGNEKIVSMTEIAGIADYVENMGYDLKGYGFVSKDIKESEKDDVAKKLASETSDEGKGKFKNEDNKDTILSKIKVDTSGMGVVRHVDDDTIVAINSEPIMSYLISDNYCYLIKNFNQNVRSYLGSGWLQKILFFISPLTALSDMMIFQRNNPSYGSGLISIYHEGGDIGVAGDVYDSWELGSITLDPDTKILKIKRGWYNGEVSYKTDGWSGRYGMPLEFLLSVHIATQMPDLAMRMATTFDTDLQLLLHSVDDGTLMPGVETTSGSIVEYAQMLEILKEDNNWLEDLWNGAVDLGDNSWFSFWSEHKHEALSYTDRALYKIFKLGIPHADGCTCCGHVPGGAGTCPGTEEIDIDEDFKNNGEFKDDSDHIICLACKKKIEAICEACKQLYDTTWNTFTPYISKVTDHWFRDLYFAVNEEEDETGVKFTSIDEEYFRETEERWTIYETWSASESIPEGYEVGDYKLYEYKDGNYTLFNGTPEKADEITAKLAQRRYNSY